jgi:hypothetical protein
VQRTKASKSKTGRYIEMQPYIASKCVTFTIGARHSKKCKDHMEKITANDTHRHDDICDTLYDGVKIGLIDKSLHVPMSNKTDPGNDVMNSLAAKMRRDHILRTQRNANH